MVNRTDDGWKPILSPDGVYYCSRLCAGGRYCRKEWYDDAVARANALAATMGEGWTTRVWENLGWHYSVSKGFVTITTGSRSDRAPRYSAWIEVPGQEQIISDPAPDPQDALGYAVQEARGKIQRLQAALTELNEIVEMVP